MKIWGHLSVSYNMRCTHDKIILNYSVTQVLHDHSNRISYYDFRRIAFPLAVVRYKTLSSFPKLV